MGTVLFLGGMAGIAALLALQAFAIVATMWVILVVVHHLPMVGKRHRHGRWRVDQRDGAASLSKSGSARDWSA